MSEEKSKHEESFVGGIPAAIWAGRRIGALEAGVKVLDVHGVPAIVAADDLSVDFREDLRERPRRINATRNFREVASFSAYVKEFASENTRIYAASTMVQIKAVLDDHEAASKDDDQKPNWCGHEALLCLEPSEEWSAWTALNKKPLKHLDFVEFLQERISTIAKPDASGIVQAARAFSASRNAKFEQVLPVEGGDISVSYSEEVRGTTKSGQAALPQALTLMLRPYRSGKAYPVEAQVRWRLSREGELTFSFALLETERVIETAFEDVRKEIAEATDITVLV